MKIFFLFLRFLMLCMEIQKAIMYKGVDFVNTSALAHGMGCLHYRDCYFGLEGLRLSQLLLPFLDLWGLCQLQRLRLHFFCTPQSFAWMAWLYLHSGILPQYRSGFPNVAPMGAVISTSTSPGARQAFQKVGGTVVRQGLVTGCPRTNERVFQGHQQPLGELINTWMFFCQFVVPVPLSWCAFYSPSLLSGLPFCNVFGTWGRDCIWLPTSAAAILG